MLRRYEFPLKIPHGLFWNFKAIAGTVNCPEIAGVIRFQFDLLPETAHVNVHRTWRNETAVAPHRIQQLIARKYTPGIARHELQKAELARSDKDFPVADSQDHGPGVNFQVADLQHRGRWRRLSTAKYRPYTSHQLPRTEGLGDIIIGPHIQATHSVHFRGFGGHKDNWR